MKLHLNNQSFLRLEKSEHTAQRRNDYEQRILLEKLRDVEKKEKCVKNELYKIRQEKYSQKYYSSPVQTPSQLTGAAPCSNNADSNPQESNDRERYNTPLSMDLTVSSETAGFSNHRTLPDEAARFRLASIRQCSEVRRRSKSREMAASEFESFKRELRRRHSAEPGVGFERRCSSSGGYERGDLCSERNESSLENGPQLPTAFSSRGEKSGKNVKSVIPSASWVHRALSTANSPVDKFELLDNSGKPLDDEQFPQRRRQETMEVSSSRKVRFSFEKHATPETESTVSPPELFRQEAKTPKLARAENAEVRLVGERDHVVLPFPSRRDEMEHFGIDLLAPAPPKSNLRAKSLARRSSWAPGTVAQIQLPSARKLSEFGGKVLGGRKSAPSGGRKWSLTRNEEKIAHQAIMRQKEIVMATANVKKLSQQYFGAGARSKEEREASCSPHSLADGSWVAPPSKTLSRPRILRRHTEGSVIGLADFKGLLSARGHKFEALTREGYVVAKRRDAQSEKALDDLLQGITQCRYLRCSLQ